MSLPSNMRHLAKIFKKTPYAMLSVILGRQCRGEIYVAILMRGRDFDKIQKYLPEHLTLSSVCPWF